VSLINASVYIWYNAVWDKFLICFPVFAVLFLASFVIAALAMDEEYGEVDDVEVGNGCVEAGGKRPCQTHEEIAKVVRVSRATPPSRNEKLRAALSCNILQILRIRPVPEIVLLAIRRPEDVVAQEVDKEDAGDAQRPELNGAEDKIACLECVDERHKEEISNSEHEPEAVARDVHGSVECRLVVQSIGNIPCLKCDHEPHRVGDLGEAASAHGLFANHTDVDENPEN